MKVSSDKIKSIDGIRQTLKHALHTFFFFMGKLKDISFIIGKREYIMQTCILNKARAFL